MNQMFSVIATYPIHYCLWHHFTILITLAIENLKMKVIIIYKLLEIYCLLEKNEYKINIKLLALRSAFC